MKTLEKKLTKKEAQALNKELRPLEQKYCPDCVTIKPYSEWGKGNNSDGKHGHCKACLNKRNKANQAKNKARKHIDIPDFKTCPDCGETKSTEGWIRVDANFDGLLGYCPECQKKRCNDRRANLRENEPARYKADNILKVSKQRGFIVHENNDHQELIKQCQAVIDHEADTGEKLECDHVISHKYGGYHHHDAIQWIPKALNAKKFDHLDSKIDGVKNWLDLPIELIPDQLQDAYLAQKTSW